MTSFRIFPGLAGVVGKDYATAKAEHEAGATMSPSHAKRAIPLPPKRTPPANLKALTPYDPPAKEKG